MPSNDVVRVNVGTRFKHPIRLRLFTELVNTFGWMTPGFDPDHIMDMAWHIGKPEYRIGNGNWRPLARDGWKIR